MNISSATTAIGSCAAVGGGLIAQTANVNVGTVGAIVAVGGLVTAILGGIGQIIKIVVEARAYDAKLKEMQADLERTRADLEKTRGDLDGSRDRRHVDASRFNGILLEQQVKIAKLEGQLGLTDASHARAINANSDNIRALAKEASLPLLAPAPHVDPAPSLIDASSDDEPNPLPR